MPFTFAHPAAVLPIHARLRQWISLPALVIGSMVPDAAYFLPLPFDYFRAHAHTFLGSFIFALPVGIAILLVFYWAAPDVAGLLPSPQREALAPPAQFPSPGLRQAWFGLAGLIIGIESHILWDSFMHDNGWFVLRLPFLLTRIWRPGLRTFHSIRYRSSGFYVYDVLEYLSTIVGLAIVLYFLDRWLQTRGIRIWTPPRPSARLYLWLGVLTVSLVEAGYESHIIPALANGTVLRNHHPLLVLPTAFTRNILIALVALPGIVKLRRLLRDGRLSDSAY